MSQENTEHPGFVRRLVNTVSSFFSCNRRQQHPQNDAPIDMNDIPEPRANIETDQPTTGKVSNDLSLNETLDKLGKSPEQLVREQPIAMRAHDNKLTPVE